MYIEPNDIHLVDTPSKLISLLKENEYISIQIWDRERGSGSGKMAGWFRLLEVYQAARRCVQPSEPRLPARAGAARAAAGRLRGWLRANRPRTSGTVFNSLFIQITQYIKPFQRQFQD